MLKLKFFFIIPSVLILFLSCTPWVSVVVEPENFVSLKTQFDTFLFGSYSIDADEGIYLDLRGSEPDLLLNRVYTHAFAPGKVDYFLIPIPSGIHNVRAIYFSYGPEEYGYEPYYYPYDYPYGITVFRWGWGFHHFRYYYYEPYPYVYYYNPARFYRYPFVMNLDKGKIYYFGRINLTNGKFYVENRFDEDKNALQDSFQGDTNAYLELSRSEFSNLLK